MEITGITQHHVTVPLDDAFARLTERQQEALVRAYELGYYETPRSVSFEEVAAELDCASSTANELLRRAEATVVEAVLTS
jgi:predicted DNA binding protein